MAAEADIPDPGKWTEPGPVHVDGNVDYKEAHIKNSIATGHIHGYEVILATINVTVDAANNLTKDIQQFVAKVDLQLNLVSSKVGATASVLGSISALVVKQASKKGLTVDKEVKEIRSMKTDRGNIAGSPEETRQKRHAANEILTMTCFHAIKERTEGAHKAFDDISQKIKEALKAISLLQKLHKDGQEAATGVGVRGPGPDGQSAQNAQQRPGTSKGKVGLSDEDRKTVLLTEENLTWMEKKVEIHWKDLYYRFIIFEFSLGHDRQDKEEENIESIKQELESVKRDGKNTWVEIKRLAEYLCGNDEPPRPPDGIRGPLPRPPPEAFRRYLPDPSRVNSLYVGWEFRKSLPLPPPHPYGLLDEPAEKPSWRFATPQRMPFSTEELFLRVLAQAGERAKSDRTLMDEYWGALKKARQRALVDELVQVQNHHLLRDFPQLEWTIAGLETKTDPMALTVAHARSRARGKKTRKSITAFEVILKTQWRITRGYGPPMPIPGGIRGPTPVGPSGVGMGMGMGTGPLPGGGRGHSQTRPRESTRSKHRPTQLVLVEGGGNRSKKSKNKKENESRKDAEEHKNRQQTSQSRVHVELREPGAAGASDGGHRHSSPPGQGNSHQPPLIPPLQPPPPPRPASGFVPSDGGRRRVHIPPVPPGARPPPPQPTHIHMSSAQRQRAEEEEEEEAEEVFKQIFEEFSELADPKGKKKRRGPGAAISVSENRRSKKGNGKHPGDAEPDASISMSLMRQVEQASRRRLTAEGEELHNKSVRLEQMAEGQAPPPPPPPPPPPFVVPVPAESKRRARKRESRAGRVIERPQMEVERARKKRL